MTDDLTIPDFLRRPFDPVAQAKQRRKIRQRELTIPYPKDGYAGKGLRRRRRHALKIEQCGQGAAERGKK